MSAKRAVFLVDDDEPVLVALSRTLRLEGYEVRSWTSALRFLEEHDPNVEGCLICDLVMPTMTGLELQRELMLRGSHRPIIFLSGLDDVQSATQDIRADGARFLSKPVARSDLLRAVKDAVSRDQIARQASAHAVQGTDTSRGNRS